MSPNSWFAALLGPLCLLLAGSWGPRLAAGARIVEEGHHIASGGAAAGAVSARGGSGEESEAAKAEKAERSGSENAEAGGAAAAPLAAVREDDAPVAKVVSPRWRAAAWAEQAERAGDAAAEAVASSAAAAAHAVLAEAEAVATAIGTAQNLPANVAGSPPQRGVDIATAEVELGSSEARLSAQDRSAARHVPSPGGEPPTPTEWARRLGIPTGGRCALDGNAAHLGCAAGCSCGWDQQCYAKFVYVDAGEGEPMRLDVGTCEAGMPVLVFGSLMLFLATLLAVVVLRLWLLGHISGEDPGDEPIVIKASPRIQGRGMVPTRAAPPPQDHDDISSDTSEDDSQSQGSGRSSGRKGLPSTPPASVRGPQPAAGSIAHPAHREPRR